MLYGSKVELLGQIRSGMEVNGIRQLIAIFADFADMHCSHFLDPVADCRKQLGRKLDNLSKPAVSIVDLVDAWLRAEMLSLRSERM